MKRVMTPRDYAGMLRRTIRAAGCAFAVCDVADLVTLIEVRSHLDQAIQDAVDGLRASGATWRELGAATGTSHVAALKKWGKRNGAWESES